MPTDINEKGSTPDARKRNRLPRRRADTLIQEEHDANCRRSGTGLQAFDAEKTAWLLAH